MGNRGSKSEICSFCCYNNKIVQIPVKEQRVDGSWSIVNKKNILLRCTLMDFERNYQVKILSKQFSVKNYSTFTYPSYVNPYI